MKRRAGERDVPIDERGRRTSNVAERFLDELFDRPEIDPRVTGAGHLVEHGVPIRDAGQDAYGQLEGAVADWRVGDDDVARFRHECSLGAVAIAGSEGRARGVRL